MFTLKEASSVVGEIKAPVTVRVRVELSYWQVSEFETFEEADVHVGLDWVIMFLRLVAPIY